MMCMSRWVVAALIGGLAGAATTAMAQGQGGGSPPIDVGDTVDKAKDRGDERGNARGVPEMSPATAGSVALLLVGGAALLTTRRRPRGAHDAA
jgi:hypothetical protein